ncbi:phage head morphogenesis protein [Pendulispora brunnea]|uniref:Phage head morphogenesis protein n=1 Tax=Pendulispora brunnea TaxID=2905690 RepID=A0ABZ2KRT1_9BACT
MWSVSTDPLDFDEAIAWHRARAPLSKQAWDALTEAAQKKAFTVANVTQLDLVTQVWDAVDSALKQGLPFEDFKRSVGDGLERAWQGTVANPAARLEVIFRTNLQIAYGAGRYARATEPDVLAERPFWLFDAILDARTSEICEECDGTVRPADDAWWREHQPPLHHQCRSSFTTLTAEQAHELGGVSVAPKAKASSGFGLASPAHDWAPKEQGYPPELWAQFEAKHR